MDISDELDAEIIAERERSEPPRRTVQRAPNACRRCGVEFRPYDVKPEERPGTRKHAGRGLCATHLAEYYLKETPL